MHRDVEPTSGPGDEGEGAVVRLGDAFDDCQAEADTSVVGAYAFGAAKNGSTSVETNCGVSCSPVFSTVSTTLLG